ncbi:MAG: response regulator [Phycisphaerales bacterium]|nr:response regulator [Phycisphaerales bacterium]
MHGGAGGEHRLWLALGMVLPMACASLGVVSPLAGALGGVAAAALLGLACARMLRAVRRREAAMGRMAEDLRRRDRDIEHRRAKAEAASAAKTVVLRRASHNMRSPLSSILGLTDALIARTPPGPSRKQLRTVRSSAQHLLDLANELLDMARTEAGGTATNARSINPAELLEEIAETFTDRAKAKGVALWVSWRGEAPASVFLDPKRLREVLVNFIDNAVRHTSRGAIGIEARAEPRDGSLTIEITDTGEGVDPDRLQRLLAADDLPTHSSPDRGTHGLGLAITRHLVTAMGGKMEINSRVGVGTNIALRLPASPVRMAAPGAPPARAVGPSPDPPEGVMVIDDAPEIRHFMKVALAEHRVDAHLAGSVEEAVNAAGSSGFRLVFLDQHLGATDGASMLADLRAAMPGAAFIALTSDITPDAMRQYRAAEFDGVLPKPFEPRELGEILDRFLPRRARRAA